MKLKNKAMKEHIHKGKQGSQQGLGMCSEPHPWHASARLNFLGFTSHYYLSCLDEEKPLHSYIFSGDLLWFLGRRLSLLA